MPGNLRLVGRLLEYAAQYSGGMSAGMNSETTNQSNRVDEELMKIMVCPISHAPLVQVGDWLYSTDPNTRRKYPVRDSIPIMLVDESQIAEQVEFDKIMDQSRTGK